MQKIISIFRGETIYFIKELGENARRILYSDAIHSIASPLSNIFLVAFIWVNTKSFLSVMLFEVGTWIFLPIAFYINGHLLKKINIKYNFILGNILYGISPLLLLLVTQTNNYLIFISSCIYGFGIGFYWANRNYIEFKETINENRKYFFSIIYVISNICSVVIPLIAGWFIVFGEKLNFYYEDSAYWILFIISFILSIIATITISKGNFNYEKLSSIKIKTNKFFTRRRILGISKGLSDSVGFIPSVLLLYYFGSEGILGTFSSLATIAVIISIYLYGRFTNTKYQNKTIFYSLIIFFIGSLALVTLPESFSIIFFTIIISIANNFFGVSMESLSLTLSDEENTYNTNSRYAYILDNEVFLNTGRVLGVIIMIIIYINYSQSVAIFYSSIFIIALSLIFISFFFRK